jgi:hypothetical protein
MKINPKSGVDQLLFGMKQDNVTAIYGQPDKQFKDDDKNIIYLYNENKLRLTFYEDEEYRLGYIICTHPDSVLMDKKVIGCEVEEMKQELILKGLKSWEQESFDSIENHFNEANWLILQSEFGEIIRVEIGAIINDKDEVDWKFKS